MTENEMAAIAAGLWEPGQRCERNWRTCNGLHLSGQPAHFTEAPDMHDRANWLRGLENLTARGLYVDACFYPSAAAPHVRFTIWPKGKRISEPPLAEACGPIADTPFVAALVALYKVEHPDEMEDETK